jgi:hypothetical protein
MDEFTDLYMTCQTTLPSDLDIEKTYDIIMTIGKVNPSPNLKKPHCSFCKYPFESCTCKFEFKEQKDTETK